MEKKIALIIVAIWLGVVACKLSCTNGKSVQNVQYVQKEQQPMKADEVEVDSVAADSTGVTADGTEAAVDDADTECRSYERTIYSKDGRRIYFEVDNCMVYCYAKAGNKSPRKMIFGHEYGEDCFPIMYSHTYGDNVFVVGDFMPNSNGWTVRFPIYKINARTFRMTYVDEGAAIYFGRDGFRIAKCRLTNPDATCTADERWVMHDAYYNSAGKKVREDRHEYDWNKMEEMYGDTLVNACRVRNEE
jgi:hypothetical protein